jgi:ribosomal-protein-serine acetyltransferase
MNHPPFHLRIDDQLELRQRMPEDAEDLFALTDLNRSYLKEWLPWLDFCSSPGDTRANIEASLKQAADGTGLALAIWVKGQMVGVTGFNEISRMNRIGQIGYWLGEAYQGRGIMTRSVRALIEHGFAAMKLNRITITAATGNRASRSIAEKLGLRIEGTAREAEWLYDHYVDTVRYAILAREWQALKDQTEIS